MDWPVVRALNAVLARHDGTEDALGLFERVSPLIYLLVLLGCFFLVAGPRRRELRTGAVAAGLAAAVGLLLVQVIGRVVDRPRPFVAHPDRVHDFLQHAIDSGFPSDHATATFAITVAIALRSRRLGAALLAVSLAVVTGRVALGVHYPSDVAAGALLGAVTAGLTAVPPMAPAIDRITDRASRVIDRVIPLPGRRSVRT